MLSPKPSPCSSATSAYFWRCRFRSSKRSPWAAAKRSALSQADMQTPPSLARRMTAEFTGTAFLVAAVVGSGIMAERLAGGNAALALLANTIATGAALVALILAFAPISGAHFNPAVSFAAALEGKLPVADALAYIAAQIAGGIAGTMAAHIMFSLPLVSLSQHARGGS